MAAGAHAVDGARGRGVPTRCSAESHALSPTTPSRDLRLLERARLIRIHRAPDDARVRLVALTPEGEERSVDAYPPWTRAQERASAARGPQLAASLPDDLEAAMAADPSDPGRAGRIPETTNPMDR